ncbi:hypothetical protein EYZ11_010267 [Aspergillus tanneri]|uniref:Uncharacterized protein n=1 Tax=Aspergillus tanneri TaxID=1220188 RepID=A0A4S3J5R8_9EURO|nr:uncharacterized protein ATNIH1004_004579 [Aspergillus tanneri]KAA8648694.1 hypothetical protein ATNIH1004_004579 [Aspergillus tanneri]THC90273.1 hypothetical protein EYZ11_010267 [Aspergillus tanneri]
MVHNLAEVLRDTTTGTTGHLKPVIFAGIAVAPQVSRKCRECLQVPRIENYSGIVEVASISTDAVQDLDTIINGHDVATAASNIPVSVRRPTPVILKAALALLAISHTNHTHAVILNLGAISSHFPFIPFIPASLGEQTLDMDPSESQDQHSAESSTSSPSTPGDNPGVTAAHPARSIFIQCPMLLSRLCCMLGLGAAALDEKNSYPFQNMTVMQIHIRTNLGMPAHAGAGGEDGSCTEMFLRGVVANCSSMWVERVADEWKNIALWLAEEES